MRQAAQSNDDKAFRKVENFLEELLTLANQHTQRLKRVTHWQAIRSRMQEFRSDHCWTWKQFLAHMQMIESGFDESRLLSYSQELHGNGFIFHYYDDPLLKNYVFIDPAWVTECIYLILEKSLLDAGGEFNTQHVKEKVKSEYAEAYIALMKKFDLIFENKETGNFIAPQYLPKELTDRITGIGKWNRLKKTFDNFSKPNFYIHFPQFLPPSVMLQLLNRYGSDAVDQTYWKNGIAFLLEGKEVLILQHAPERCFSIFIEEGNQYVARLVFDAIYQSIPYGSPLQLSVNKQDYVSFDELYKYYNNSEVATVQGKMVSTAPLRHFAQSIETLKKQTTDNKKKEVKVFISYAHEDEEEKDILVNKYLQAIQLYSDLNITIWTDAEIQGGTNWNNTITSQLDTADIVLFLISNNFIASKYIKETEIRNATDRFMKGEQVIVPVYIEKVTEELLPFKEKQFLPGGIPLKKWEDKNDAWVKIQSGLIKVFRDVKDGNTAAYFL